MTVRQQWLFVVGVLLVLAGSLYAGTKFGGLEAVPAGVGSRAPDFRAATLVGAPRVKGIDDYEGQVVLLNLWATWCPPCKREMPSIQALHERFAPHGLKVVAVSVDRPGLEQEILAFRDSYLLTFELLHDATGSIQEAYRTNGLPETFLIGRDGAIRKRVIGATDWNSAANRRLVAQLLGVSPDGPIAREAAKESAAALPPRRDSGARSSR
jgi:cytochrome c biogenesis protein CcmG/thiol:disulfide interchange protein DsbE